MQQFKDNLALKASHGKSASQSSAACLFLFSHTWHKPASSRCSWMFVHWMIDPQGWGVQAVAWEGNERYTDTPSLLWKHLQRQPDIWNGLFALSHSVTVSSKCSSWLIFCLISSPSGLPFQWDLWTWSSAASRSFFFYLTPPALLYCELFWALLPCRVQSIKFVVQQADSRLSSVRGTSHTQSHAGMGRQRVEWRRERARVGKMQPQTRRVHKPCPASPVLKSNKAHVFEVKDSPHKNSALSKELLTHWGRDLNVAS